MRRISTAKRNAKFHLVRGLKSPPLNGRDSYLRDSVKDSCPERVFPEGRRPTDVGGDRVPASGMYDPSPAKHFDARFSSYITWNCRELSGVYTSLDKCIDRGKRQEEARKTQRKKKQETQTSEKESTAREPEESSRNTLTGSLTAAFGGSRVARGGLTPGKLRFLAIGTAD